MIKHIMTRLIVLLIICVITVTYVEAQSTLSNGTPTVTNGKDDATSINAVKIIGIDPTAFPEVKINVFVDEGCAMDGNLKKENFQVKEGSADATVENLYFSGDAPGQKLDLALVIDDTKYMASQINALQFEVKDLTEKIKSSKLDARYSLVTFKGEATTRSDWTKDTDSFKKALSQVYAIQGRNNLPDNSLAGIEKALSFGFRPDAQKIIIVVTDEPSCQKGDGTSADLPSNSTYILEDVKRDIMSSGVILIAVSPDFRNPNINPSVPRSDLQKYADMRELANESGGLWIDINSKKFSNILEQIKGMITGTYTIEYMSPNQTLSEERIVSVEVSAPGCVVGSGLNSYIMPGNTTGSTRSNKMPVIDGLDRNSAQKSHLIAVMGDLSNPKHSVAFSPDGLIIAAGSENGIIVLWNAHSAKLFRTIRAHSGCINSLAFSPVGRTLASASDDCTIKLWNATNGSVIRTLEGHSGSVEGVAFSPDGRLLSSASNDCTAKLWNATNGSVIRTLKGHSGYVTSIAFSPDGRTLATGSDDRTVRIWDVSSGLLIRTLAGHSNYVECVKFSPDGRTLASASHDRTVMLWDVSSGSLIKTLQENYSVNDIAFSPDGRLLASVSDDSTFRLWYTSNGQLFRTLKGALIDDEDGHFNYVKCVAFSPDCSSLATGSDDRTVRLWNVSSGKIDDTLEGEPNDVEGVEFSPDGRTFATASDDGTARLWDPSNGSLIRTLVGDPIYVEKFDELNISRNHSNFVEGIAFSPDGRILATASDDGKIRQWDPSDGSLIKTIAAHSNDVESVSFSPDGRTLASASDDGTVRLWYASNGTLIRTFAPNGSFNNQSAHMECVKFSPDDRTIASVSANGTVRLWDAPSGSLIRTLEGNYSINIVAFSPDGRTLASGSDDRMVRLWNVSSGSLIRALVASSSDVESVAFSPDSRTIAAGADDGNVTQWDASIGSLIRTVGSHANDIESIAFSPDSRTLVSGSDDGTIRLWRLE